VLQPVSSASPDPISPRLWPPVVASISPPGTPPCQPACERGLTPRAFVMHLLESFGLHRHTFRRWEPHPGADDFHEPEWADPYRSSPPPPFAEDDKDEEKGGKDDKASGMEKDLERHETTAEWAAVVSRRRRQEAAATAQTKAQQREQAPVCMHVHTRRWTAADATPRGSRHQMSPCLPARHLSPSPPPPRGC